MIPVIIKSTLCYNVSCEDRVCLSLFVLYMSPSYYVSDNVTNLKILNSVKK
jgi:hypothetical protein